MQKIIIADTRNQQDDFVVKQLERLGYKVKRSKLPYGDFALADNMRYSVDIKSSSGGVLECAKNICSSDHRRIVEEIKECAYWHGQLCFLIANEDNINKIEDLNNWKSPLYKSDLWVSKYLKNDKWYTKKQVQSLLGENESIYDLPTKREKLHTKGEPMTRVKGETLAKALKTMSEPNRYADGLTVRFSFCSKENAGRKIAQILEWWAKTPI